MDLPMRQSLLLGAYLAHREGWVSRDELLGVFWPEDDEVTARHNLSQLVYHCRRQPWFEGLEAERTRLRWRIDSDLQLFRAALGAGAWHDALNLYRGPLLDGGPTGLSLGFETWLERERETLHGAWRDAVLEVAGACEREGRWSDAIAHLRQVLAQDALAEDVLQAYLRCAGPAGQREAALRAFEAFRTQLRTELDVAPLEATILLAERLRSPSSSPVPMAAVAAEARLEAAPDRAAEAGVAERRNFPAPLTPFVGREAERERLMAMLVDDGARLVTLLGPGGSGKTRLATEVALQAATAFGDGAVFVPLAESGDPRLLAQAFLQALGAQVPAGQAADQFLLDWLAPKSLLLVVDNLEHLLAGAGLVPELLEASPGSAAIVTSREPLDVGGEVVVDVPGLDYPTSLEQPIDGFDAVTLFVRSALRAHPRFLASPDDRAGIVRICRLLEGMPLGIELAAAWMRRLRPGEVADALETNLDLLATTHRDVPPRQRSVRATLDHSWALLSDEERAAWTATAVFRGGFDKDAADAVAVASLRTLLALVNKSLLYRASDGRFEQLAVVRQYGLERLMADAARHAELLALHADYFAALAVQAGEGLVGQGQAEWLARLARDHENLRTGLDHLRLEEREETGLRMANGLFRYWWLHGHYQEARGVFSALLRLSDDRTALRAKALSNAGGVARLCEDFADARELLQESIAIQRELGDPKPLAATLGTLGNLIRLQGEYEESERLMHESLGLYRQAEDHHMVANTLNNLGALATFRGDPVAAERWYQEAFELAKHTGEELVSAFALGNLGMSALDRGDLDRARLMHGQAHAVFERVGYQVGLAVTDQSLGDIEMRAEDTAEARRCYQRAARRFMELGDQRGIGEVLASVVAVALALDDPEWALRCVGASRALLQRLGMVMPVASREALESNAQLARECLGEARWAECLNEGARLTPEEMVALVGSGADR